MRARILAALVALLALGAWAAEATHSKEYAKKHKIFYHLNEAGNAKAIAVLTNIQNHVDTVGWENIEALELVVHGPALRTFRAKDLDPEVRGKVEKLLVGGLRIDACQIALKSQKLTDDQIGINSAMRATHRQNFLVPPRSHRSFPLAELL